MRVLNKFNCSVPVSARDFVRLGGIAGIVVACLHVLPSKKVFLQIRVYEQILSHSPHASRWRETGYVQLVDAWLLEGKGVYAAADNTFLVLEPV